MKKKLICKREALDDNGKKIIQFTKGIVYEFTMTEEDVWAVYDDNGNTEEFWDLDIMFTSKPKR